MESRSAAKRSRPTDGERGSAGSQIFVCTPDESAGQRERLEQLTELPGETFEDIFIRPCEWTGGWPGENP